ncbi:MAG: hypothetical protein OXL34_08405 [Gemmatimonadota bacterium]|nr:hypothetical protein [Gemmatimonadota bacterium]
MKTISHDQSRRNSSRRKRKVKSRHARGRRWGSGPKPVFVADRVHYEIGARINAMSFGGIGAVRRLVSKLGLAREIDGRLKLLKRHLPYHESDHMLNIAYNLLCGGHAAGSRLGSGKNGVIAVSLCKRRLDGRRESVCRLSRARMRLISVKMAAKLRADPSARAAVAAARPCRPRGVPKLKRRRE